VLTPNVSSTSLAARGFHVKDQDTRELLETIGRSFLNGYAAAAKTGSPGPVEPLLDDIPTRFRGFAYEGAAMCFAILDALPLGGGRIAGFLAGPGSPHIYMVHVGIGWAMARLPGLFWRRIRVPDPMMRWLVLDGYGFHQAYFHTDRYVRRQYRRERFPWPVADPSENQESARYADRAIDQGVGRAVWFVGGADARVVAGLIDRFPESRRADLYSGAGLAASYAGGADEAELRWLLRHAGPHRPQLCQGAVFAATARVHADLVVPHTELAARVLCEMTPWQAAELSDRLRPDTGDRPDRDPTPTYEIWRQRIADAFVRV
jgi:hypothetical protein